MTFKKFYFIVLMFVIVTTVRSQTNFLPGYIITNSNDTLRGLIDYRGSIRSSRTCTFKPEKNAESINFKPFEIKAYRFIDSKYFISKQVPGINPSESEFFLEYLVNGISDLFYYRDLSGDHYFLSMNEGPLYELINEEKKIIINGKEHLRKSNEHIQLLRMMYKDCIEINNDINKVDLSHKSLIKITKDYHNYVCNDQNCIIYEKQLPLVKIQISPFIGCGLSYLKITNDIFFSKTNYSTDYFIPLGLTFSTSLPQLSEKISFLLTTQFSKHYYYGFIETKYYSGTDNNYIHVHLLKPGLIGSFKYTFPKGKIRPSVALGGGHSFVFNSKSKRIQEAIWGTSIKTTEIKDIPIPPGLTIFTGSLGVDFKLFNNNPFFFNANYSLELGRLNKTETSIQEVGFKLGTYF